MLHSHTHTVYTSILYARGIPVLVNHFDQVHSVFAAGAVAEDLTDTALPILPPLEQLVFAFERWSLY